MSEVTVAVDTSVAVPLVVATHPAHDVVNEWASGRTLALSGHALMETYAVLTRLTGSARVAGADAVRIMDANFSETLFLPERAALAAHRELASVGIVGGATYDGLVALAAREYGMTLASRDARALPTYDAVGVRVELIRGPAGAPTTD